MLQINATDIIEHLPTLSALSQECSHITEMGVRDCVSTWAFIDGLSKTNGELVSIDINYPPKENLEEVENICKKLNVKFTFIQGDTGTPLVLAGTDLLFIDTDHTREQLTKEFKFHSSIARKYIVLHDTESAKELWQPIGELLWQGNWKIKQHYQNNNGLTVLERIKK